MGFGFKPDVESAIVNAANRYGLDPVSMLAIAKIESGGNPLAKNRKSSAGGLFQFIDSTADQYRLANRFDAYQASDAAARLARDNSKHLKRALGRAPGPGELYLAHQQGAGGASRLLRDPNARAVDIVGADAVRLNGGTPDMTAAEFASLWTSKANKLTGTPYQQPSGGGAPQPQQGQTVSNEVFQAALERQGGGNPSQNEKMAQLGKTLIALEGGAGVPDALSNALQSIQGNPIFKKKKGFSL